MGVATAVAIGSAVVGAAGAASNRSAARRAADQQAASAEQQVALGREQLAFGREQYADWREMFYPALNDLRTMAYEEQTPDYAAIGADVNAAFDTSQEINRRQQQRFGLQPGDGAVQEGELRYGLGRALATVNGRNMARTATKDQRWNRLASFANLSNGMQANAQSTINQGFAATGGAMAGQGAMFGQQAAGYGQAAAAGAQMSMYGLNQLAQSPWAQPSAPPASTAGPWAQGYNYGTRP